MDTTYDYGNQQTAEPFWQRIRKFFLLPLDKAVLLRIFALSGALTVALVLPLLGGLGLALLAAVVFALLVVGASYGFKIIERSSKGYLIPSDYGLTDQSAVGPLLPYKFAALIVAFAAFAVILNRTLGAFDLAGLIVLGVVFAALLPAVSMRLVTTGSLRSALSLAEIFGVVRKIGRPYAALSGFAFGGMLGGLSAQQFLRRHWQKRPLVVRGAFPGFRGAATRAQPRSRAALAKAARSTMASPIATPPRGASPEPLRRNTPNGRFWIGNSQPSAFAASTQLLRFGL